MQLPEKYGQDFDVSSKGPEFVVKGEVKGLTLKT
jgi:hypothetical protein